MCYSIHVTTSWYMELGNGFYRVWWMVQTIFLLKLAFRSQSIHFDEGSCIEVWRKNKTTLVYLPSNCPQALTHFYDWPVKYYFWRLRYMITMAIGSCLYIPHGHYFISNLWLWILDVYVSYQIRKFWLSYLSIELLTFCNGLLKVHIFI